MTKDIPKFDQLDSSTNIVKFDKTADDSPNSKLKASLSESTVNIESSKSIQKLAKSSRPLSKRHFKLNYKGNKNGKQKGKFSEIPDVLNKNLIRSLSRYLAELYIYHNGVLHKSNKSISNKKTRVKSFYQKFFKSKAKLAKDLSENEELGVLHVLSIFVKEAVNYRNDCKEYRTIKQNLNKMIKTYSSRLYQNVITVDGLAILMDLVKQTGHIKK